jgi:hypothetical protein
MTIEEVGICFRVLGLREKPIAKLAVLAGMRPGEIFALTWGEIKSTCQYPAAGLPDFIGAGDRDRTGDIQLGKMAVN